TTFLPLGPKVVLTVSANLSTPFNNECLAFSENLISLAILYATFYFKFYYLTTANKSLSRRTKYFSPSYFKLVPEYLSKNTVSPFATDIGIKSPFALRLPFPTAIISPI